MVGLGSEEAAWGRRTPVLGLAGWAWQMTGVWRGGQTGREATADPSQQQGAGQGGRAEGSSSEQAPGAGPACLCVLGLDVDPQISVQFFMYRHAAPSSERQPLLPG